jgi:hypothetical protein
MLTLFRPTLLLHLRSCLPRCRHPARQATVGIRLGCVPQNIGRFTFQHNHPRAPGVVLAPARRPHAGRALHPMLKNLSLRQSLSAEPLVTTTI